MMKKNMGAFSGSREPDPISGSGPAGFDPARGVYVVIGSSGEYSGRYERVIGFVLTEDEAQAVVARAEHEIGLPDPMPYPSHVSEYGYQLEDGSWWEGIWYDRPLRAVWREKPDAAEIRADKEAAVAAWRQSRIDAGRIDPDGSMDSYYYEFAPAIAMEAAKPSSLFHVSTRKGDSAGPQDISQDNVPGSDMGKGE